MTDLRRFLRYIVPGLTSVIELLIALIISDLSVMKDFFKLISECNNIGLIISAFFVSGGIGYIYAIIYFAIYWIQPNGYFSIDYRSIFIDLKDKLEIVDASGENFDIQKLSKIDAFKIISQFWNINKETNLKIKSMYPMIERFHDIFHGLGITFIGAIISFLCWIYLHFFVFIESFSFNIQDLFINLGWLFLLIIIYKNYIHTKNVAQSSSKSIVASEVLDEFQKNNTLVRLYYVE